jgi:hypothetical protein
MPIMNTGCGVKDFAAANQCNDVQYIGTALGNLPKKRAVASPFFQREISISKTVLKPCLRAPKP